MQAVAFFAVVYVLWAYRPAHVRVHKSESGDIIIEDTQRKPSLITIFYKRDKTTLSAEK